MSFQPVSGIEPPSVTDTATSAPRQILRPVPEDAELVTVVVPARNEERSIADCLDSILTQDWPALQVLVVDGASSDRTAAIVQEFASRDPRVELLTNPAGIIPRSLNIALAAARGKWFVRVDAHARISSGYLRRAVDHLRTGRWGGVGGRKDGVGVTPAGRAIAVALASRFGGGSTYHYGTTIQAVEHVPFGAYNTALARELGGWDDRLQVNQDFEFDYRLRRAGHELLFDPSLVIEWRSRQTLRDLYGQYRRYGRGKVAVAALHPRSLSARHLIAPLFVASLAAACLLAFRRPVLAAGIAAPYAIALFVASAAAGRRLRDARSRLFLPAAFVTMHVGWGVGFIAGVVRWVTGRQPPFLRGDPIGTDVEAVAPEYGGRHSAGG